MTAPRVPYPQVAQDLLQALLHGERTVHQLVRITHYSDSQVRNALTRLSAAREVQRVATGTYRHANPLPVSNTVVPRRQHVIEPMSTGKTTLNHCPDMSTPPARPGAMDYAALPSRRGDRLHFRDGRIETIGAAA